MSWQPHTGQNHVINQDHCTKTHCCEILKNLIHQWRLNLAQGHKKKKKKEHARKLKCKLYKNLKLTPFAGDTLSYTRNVRGSSSWKLTSEGVKIRLNLVMSLPKFFVTKITWFWGSMNTHWNKTRNHLHIISLIKKKIHTLSIRPQIYHNLRPQT